MKNSVTNQNLMTNTSTNQECVYGSSKAGEIHNNGTESAIKNGTVNKKDSSITSSYEIQKHENITQNDRSIFFDEPAKEVSEKLTANIEQTAESFLTQEDFLKKIDNQFDAQILTLGKVCTELETRVNVLNDNTDKLEMLKIHVAIAEINGIVGRLGGTYVGGFGKSLLSELEDLKKSNSLTEAQTARKEELENSQFEEVEADIKKNIKTYNNEKWILNNPYLTKEEQEKSRKKCVQILDGVQSEAVKKSFGVLKGNLKKLNEVINKEKGKSVHEKSTPRDIEKMLNFIQKCALSAWMFNDIAEQLGNIGVPKTSSDPEEASLEKLGVLSNKNEQMLELNKKARKTTMFTESSITKLMGEVIKKENKEKKENRELTDKEIETKIAEEQWELIGDKNGENYAKILKFLQDYRDVKIGPRGRSWINEKEEDKRRVETQPIGNTGAEKNVSEKGKLFEKFKNDKQSKSAIKGFFVPKETANLDMVPPEMLRDLYGIMDTGAGKEIIELLKKAGYIEVEKDREGKITKIKSKPSFANIINKAGLPTYCSVSGTTGEIVSVLHCTLKEGNSSPFDKVFENLLKIAGGEEPDPEDYNFSTFFAPVATFMEIGHYHTTAEVLGGFYSVAVADNQMKIEEKIEKKAQTGKEGTEKIQTEGKEAEQTSEDGFGKLLKYFNEHQGNFLGNTGTTTFHM